MVPVWFRHIRERLLPGSSLEPGSKAALLFFGLYLFYGLFHLTLLTDWVGYAVDEGFTTYGAQRVREGQVPHRDFFFLWTPGILYLHSLLQEIGASAALERAASLTAAAISAALVFRWSWVLGMTLLPRTLLAFLLLLWGFTLWNIPYSSWFAVAWAATAVESGRHGRWALAGLLFALSFWFKQNVGILACAGMLGYLAVASDFGRARRLLLTFLPGLVLPFLGFWIFGGKEMAEQAIRQIFFFPLRYPALMGEPFPKHLIGTPLSVLGFWVISLYFFRAPKRIRGLAQAAVLLYLAVGVFRIGRDFFLGCFFLYSLLAWAGSLIMALKKKNDFSALFLWIPLFGAFLQVFPRWDFQHFLFVLPLSALMLLWALSELKKHYSWLPGVWVYLPAILLLAGGVVMQARLNLFHLYSRKDPTGQMSFGDGHKLNQEMEEVKAYLASRGLQAGDPVLVVPNATVFYRFSGFHNPTPHDQFFPGYVEAFGAREQEVLEGFELAGGEYVVFQQRSKTEQFAPALAEELKRRYETVKDFPFHFSVMRKIERGSPGR